MYIFFEKGMRSGPSFNYNRYSKANINDSMIRNLTIQNKNRDISYT